MLAASYMRQAKRWSGHHTGEPASMNNLQLRGQEAKAYRKLDRALRNPPAFSAMSRPLTGIVLLAAAVVALSSADPHFAHSYHDVWNLPVPLTRRDGLGGGRCILNKQRVDDGVLLVVGMGVPAKSMRGA